jgi:hypothetical protein
VPAVHELKAHKRVWLPLAGAAVCMVAMIPSGPILTWVFVLAAFAFILDAVSMAWPRGDNATHNRQ